MDTDGDPRVHLALNLVLSAAFAVIVLWGLDLIGAVAFTVPKLLLATAALMLLTRVVTT